MAKEIQEDYADSDHLDAMDAKEEEEMYANIKARKGVHGGAGRRMHHNIRMLTIPAGTQPGLVLSSLYARPGTYVASVHHWSPLKGQLKAGDSILALDCVDVSHESPELLSDRLRLPSIFDRQIVVALCSVEEEDLVGLSRPGVNASQLIDTDGDVEQGIPRGEPSSNAEPFLSTFIVPSGVAGAMPPFTGAIGHMSGLFNRGWDASSSNAPAVGEYSIGVFEMVSPEQANGHNGARIPLHNESYYSQEAVSASLVMPNTVPEMTPLAPHQASAIECDSGAVVEDTSPRIADATLGSLAESDRVKSHVAEADRADMVDLIAVDICENAGVSLTELNTASPTTTTFTDLATDFSEKLELAALVEEDQGANADPASPVQEFAVGTSNANDVTLSQVAATDSAGFEDIADAEAVTASHVLESINATSSMNGMTLSVVAATESAPVVEGTDVDAALAVRESTMGAPCLHDVALHVTAATDTEVVDGDQDTDVVVASPVSESTIATRSMNDVTLSVVTAIETDVVEGDADTDLVSASPVSDSTIASSSLNDVKLSVVAAYGTAVVEGDSEIDLVLSALVPESTYATSSLNDVTLPVPVPESIVAKSTLNDVTLSENVLTDSAVSEEQADAASPVPESIMETSCTNAVILSVAAAIHSVVGERDADAASPGLESTTPTSSLNDKTLSEVAATDSAVVEGKTDVTCSDVVEGGTDADTDVAMAVPESNMAAPCFDDVTMPVAAATDTGVVEADADTDADADAALIVPAFTVVMRTLNAASFNSATFEGDLDAALSVPEPTMETSTLNDVTSTCSTLLEGDANTKSIITTNTLNAVSLSLDEVSHGNVVEGDADSPAPEPISAAPCSDDGTLSVVAVPFSAVVEGDVDAGAAFPVAESTITTSTLKNATLSVVAAIDFAVVEGDEGIASGTQSIMARRNLNDVTLSEVAVIDSLVVEGDKASPVPEPTIASKTLSDSTSPLIGASDSPASEGDADATLPGPESTMAISIVNDIRLLVVTVTDSIVVQGDAASTATESAIASSSLNDATTSVDEATDSPASKGGGDAGTNLSGPTTDRPVVEEDAAPPVTQSILTSSALDAAVTSVNEATHSPTSEGDADADTTLSGPATDSIVVQGDAASTATESAIASSSLNDATTSVDEATDSPASEGGADADKIVSGLATDYSVVEGDAAPLVTESTTASSALDDATTSVNEAIHSATSEGDTDADTTLSGPATDYPVVGGDAASPVPESTITSRTLDDETRSVDEATNPPSSEGGADADKIVSGLATDYSVVEGDATPPVTESTTASSTWVDATTSVDEAIESPASNRHANADTTLSGPATYYPVVEGDAAPPVTESTITLSTLDDQTTHVNEATDSPASEGDADADTALSGPATDHSVVEGDAASPVPESTSASNTLDDATTSAK